MPEVITTPPPLQPAARRVGARARRTGSSGPGRGRSSRRPRGAAGVRPGCYLCPGNVRANGERNPGLRGDVRLRQRLPGAAARERPPAPSGGRAARGRAGRGTLPRAVLLAAPRPDARRDGRRRRSGRWSTRGRARSRRSGARRRSRYVQVFENKGAMMGCSNPHPHGQIWATSYVPLDARAQARDAERATLERHGRDLLGDYLEQELRRASASSCRNEHWVGARARSGRCGRSRRCWCPCAACADLPVARRRRARRPGRRRCAAERPLRQPVPHARSRTRWASTDARRTARSTPSGGCTPSTTRRCCARPRCASSWSATS